MLRILKELYLTAFTIFFRFGVGWSAEMRALNGVGGVAFVEFVFLVSVASCVDMLTGTRTSLGLSSTWRIVAACLTLCPLNHYFLVVRAHGIAFERQFSHLKKPK